VHLASGPGLAANIATGVLAAGFCLSAWPVWSMWRRIRGGEGRRIPNQFEDDTVSGDTKIALSLAADGIALIDRSGASPAMAIRPRAALSRVFSRALAADPTVLKEDIDAMEGADWHARARAMASKLTLRRRKLVVVALIRHTTQPGPPSAEARALVEAMAESLSVPARSVASFLTFAELERRQDPEGSTAPDLPTIYEQWMAEYGEHLQTSGVPDRLWRDFGASLAWFGNTLLFVACLLLIGLAFSGTVGYAMYIALALFAAGIVARWPGQRLRRRYQYPRDRPREGARSQRALLTDAVAGAARAVSNASAVIALPPVTEHEVDATADLAYFFLGDQTHEPSVGRSSLEDTNSKSIAYSSLRDISSNYPDLCATVSMSALALALSDGPLDDAERSTLEAIGKCLADHPQRIEPTIAAALDANGLSTDEVTKP
jgi:hypothetical protein